MLKLHVSDAQTQRVLQLLETSPASMKSGELLIGRSTDCRIVLEDTRVSRNHAKICFQNQQYGVMDMGSKFGSSLNGQPLTPQQFTPIRSGDTLKILDFIVAIELADPNLNVQPATLLSLDETKLLQDTDDLSPSSYMPVAMVDVKEMPRWQKGDLEVRCVQIINESSDVKTFRFVADPPVLFTYKPGQFATLDLPINGESVLRSYSISSTPSRPHTIEFTIKRVPAPKNRADVPPGLVSNWLHDNLRVGDRITINGPLGKFTCFQNPSRKLLFISAGSGITPMMSMSRWIYDTASNCDVIFFHSARTPEDIIYRQELELLAARQANFQLTIAITRPDASSPWSGLRGRLSPAMLALIAPDFKERHVYVCGPDAFMAATKSLLEEMGFPMAQYSEESFGGAKKDKAAVKAAPPANPPTPAPKFGLGGLLGSLQPSGSTPPAMPAAAPEPVASGNCIVFSKSGKEVQVDGEQTILEVAEEAGVKIRSSCRVGTCGTCKKIKREGEVVLGDHDHEALEPEEWQSGYILTCSAYAKGRVVIEA